MGKLDDRVVLVTGGQRGLGAATLREMAAEGATCVVNYPGELEKEAADALVKELNGQGVSALAIAADVTEDDQVAAMIEQIKERFGRLDVLVNNAGINPLMTWDDIDRESWDRTIEVNLSGVFVCCKAVLGLMREQKKGSIINIASVAAFIGRGNADYIASKSALLGLTRSLARQYGRYGIRANCVSPGFHDTEMTRRARQTSTESADEFIKAVPLGYLAEADSIGKAVLFLATDDAYYITGHNLVVDGGLTLR
jgi:NAD(P)-dependent dehydrogenase (short-subunit alcohol dehydrogenase family)